MTANFDALFRRLTGFAPLSWQSRLYSEHFQKNDLPSAIDVPTGLGKTAVIALWLIAKATGIPLPCRLVYVVDRRAVVDQATEFVVSLRKELGRPEAESLRQGLGLGPKPPSNSRSVGIPACAIRTSGEDTSSQWLTSFHGGRAVGPLGCFVQAASSAGRSPHAEHLGHLPNYDGCI